MKVDERITLLARIIFAGAAAIGCDFDLQPDVENEASITPPIEALSQSPGPAELKKMKRHIDRLYDRDSVIHTFKVASGDVVDCVPIDEQPAMRAPDMEGHVIVSSPSTVPEGIDTTTTQDARERDLGMARMFELDGVDEDGAFRSCPDQTIPIRRPDLHSLARFHTLGDALSKHPSLSSDRLSVGAARPEPSPQLGSSEYHQYAVATQNVINRGSQSTLNVWSPYVHQPSEFSLSQIWVVRGTDASLETVEAGWQAFRQKYGDWYARFFIFFTPDNYAKNGGGCYNLDCAGFVQTNKSVLIGGKFDKYSVKDGYQKEITVSWYKDGDAGHWWLRLDGSWVGYYPRSKFDANGLRDRASRVDFGGEIIDDQINGVHTHTDMGSGKFAYLGFRKAAYHKNVRYIDTNLSYHEAAPKAEVTDPSCYDMLLYKSATWGRYFYFGGAGYSPACQ